MFKNPNVAAVVSSLVVLAVGFVLGITVVNTTETEILPLIARFSNSIMLVIVSIVLVLKIKENKALKSKLEAK